jgi:hypothetical protein
MLGCSSFATIWPKPGLGSALQGVAFDLCLAGNTETHWCRCQLMGKLKLGFYKLPNTVVSALLFDLQRLPC